MMTLLEAMAEVRSRIKHAQTALVESAMGRYFGLAVDEARNIRDLELVLMQLEKAHECENPPVPLGSDPDDVPF